MDRAKSTDRLYRNDSDKTGLHFTNVSREAGIMTEGWGLGVGVSDVNDDGWPDVYAANDFQSNDLLLDQRPARAFSESHRRLHPPPECQQHGYRHC